jgi:hypothetical protein
MNATKKKETYFILAVLVIIFLGFTTTVSAIDMHIDLGKTYQAKQTDVRFIEAIDLWDLSLSQVQILSTAGDNSDIQTIHTPQIQKVVREFTTTSGTFEGIHVTITGDNPSKVNWLTKPDYKIYTTPSVPTFKITVPGKTGNPLVTKYNESWDKGASLNLYSVFLSAKAGYQYITGGLCYVNPAVLPIAPICSGVFHSGDFDVNDISKTLSDNRVSLDPVFKTDKASARNLGLFDESTKATTGKYYISAISQDQGSQTTSVYALYPIVVLKLPTHIKWINNSGAYITPPFTYVGQSSQDITLKFKSKNNPDIANIRKIGYLFINDTVKYAINVKIDTNLLAQRAQDRWETAFDPATQVVDLLYQAIQNDMGTPYSYSMKVQGTTWPPASTTWSVIAITPGYGISGTATVATADKSIIIPAENLVQLNPGLYDVYLMGTDINNDIVALDQAQVRVIPAYKTDIGYYQPGITGKWNLDYNENGRWDGPVIDRRYVAFGTTGSVPVTGDWTNDNRAEIGYYKPGLNGKWFLDYNGNGIWDGKVIDRKYTFGTTGSVPVTGDWNGDGTTEIGYYKPVLNGKWFLDYNGNGIWDGKVIDRKYTFGTTDSVPVTGDWNGDGTTEIGSYLNGQWRLDFNGNGIWDGPVIDRQYTFGTAVTKPVTGDWNSDGKTEIGSYLNGQWLLDYNGNGIWNGPVIDRQFVFGTTGSVPVTGVWPLR